MFHAEELRFVKRAFPSATFERYLVEVKGTRLVTIDEAGETKEKTAGAYVTAARRNVAILARNEGRKERRAWHTCVLSALAAFNRRTKSPCSFTRFDNVSLVLSAIASSTMWSCGESSFPCVPVVGVSPYT